MPLTKKVSYSRVMLLPSGYKTLALFDKNNKLIECRICEYDEKENKFNCPSRITNPEERNRIAKKIGINPKTNLPIKQKK
jgi:hypothetical protein